MSSTTFSDGVTVIASSWLNDVNNGIYNVLPTITGGGQTLIPTIGGTTTLTANSNYEQIFQNGTTTQTCVLPVVATLVLGKQYWLKNESSYVVTVNSSNNSSLVVSLNPGDSAIVTCIALTGVTNTSWDLQINAQRNGDVTQTMLVSPATLSTHAVQTAQAPVIGWGGTSTGSANAHVIAPAIPVLAYAAGQKFQFKAGYSNSGATTLAVSALGTIAVQINGNALVGGEIVSGKTYTVLLDSASTAQLQFYSESYIEGTWTPTLTSVVQVGTPANTFNYVKIGKMVTYTIVLKAATSTTLTQGVSTISPPFTIALDATNYCSSQSTLAGLGGATTFAAGAAITTVSVSAGAGVGTIISGTYFTSY